MRYILTLFALFILCLALMKGAMNSELSASDQRPFFDFSIKPLSLEQTSFLIKGYVAFPGEGAEMVKLYLMPWHREYRFRVCDRKYMAENAKEIQLNRVAGNPESCKLYFEGTSALSGKKCAAADDEIYCLNNCPPNPEVIYDSGLCYKVRFDLPQGYEALAPDATVPLSNGIEFHIARFGKPEDRSTKNFMLHYQFPADFRADARYLSFLEKTLERWTSFFGKPGFSTLKVGAIRRGQGTNEISGSPAGNLILFSRTALGEHIDLSSLKSLGVEGDISESLRQLVIAHELSHFWFSEKYRGKDGWMVEGIPQYLGLYAVQQGNKAACNEVLKLFNYYDSQISQESPALKPFGDGPLYILAYYRGPLVLYRIGEKVGHQNLMEFMTVVYEKNANPSFNDFDVEFRSRFPAEYEFWKNAWKSGNLHDPALSPALTSQRRIGE